MNRIKVIVFTLALVVTVVIGLMLMQKGEITPLMQREAAAHVLAEYLKKAAKPTQVLVMSNPFSKMQDRPEEVYSFQNSAVRGLEKGFGDDVNLKVLYPRLKSDVLANPDLPPVEPSSKTPLSFLITEVAFDELTSLHRADVIVSLIGLPANLKVVSSWQKEGLPSYGLLLPDWRIIGGTNDILNAFHSKKLMAAVIPKPGAVSQLTGPQKTPQEIFDTSFILVHSLNIEEMLKTQPQLFRY